MFHEFHCTHLISTKCAHYQQLYSVTQYILHRKLWTLMGTKGEGRPCWHLCNLFPLCLHTTHLQLHTTYLGDHYSVNRILKKLLNDGIHVYTPELHRNFVKIPYFWNSEHELFRRKFREFILQTVPIWGKNILFNESLKVYYLYIFAPEISRRGARGLVSSIQRQNRKLMT